MEATIKEAVEQQMRNQGLGPDKYNAVLDIVVRNCNATKEIFDSIEEAVDHEAI